MRRWMMWAAGVAIVFFVVGTALPSAAAEILIGMNTPMTGANAANGALWIKAAKLAEKQINASGGINGKLIKLLIVDDQSTNPGALAAVNKSIEQDKVLALLGVTTSTQILAVSETVKKAGIPTLVGGPAVHGWCLSAYWNHTEVEAQVTGDHLEGRLISFASTSHLSGEAANLVSGVPGEAILKTST